LKIVTSLRPNNAARLYSIQERSAARLAQRVRIDRHALLALVLALFAWAPLLSPNYFMGAHDAHHSLFFPIQFHEGIRDGFWLPRWGADFAHGYGYPMFVFYAPLTFYIWESFHLTDLFGVVASTKATFALGFLLGAAGIYAYARDLWGRSAALLAALVYTYLPYHLLNIYVRAALAEFTAMALLPWITLAFRRLVRRPSVATVAAAAGSYGALLLTHNITALLFTPLLAASILWELAQVTRAQGGFRHFGVAPLFRRILPVAGSALLGVALSTAVWLPGLTEQADIKIEQWALQTYRYEDHFVWPSQLLSPEWGFGYSVPGVDDGMSFQLGIAALGLAILGLSQLWLKGQGARLRNGETVIFYAVSLAVLVALMLPPARWIWDLSPLSTLIQFPWRLLAVAALPLALLAGSAAPLLAPGNEPMAPGLVLAGLLVIGASLGYTQPQTTPPNPRDETQQTWRDYEAKHPDMVAMVAQTQVQPTNSPMLAALEANETPQRFEAVTPGITIEQLHAGGGSGRARVVAEQPGTVRYLTYWYPGWSATLNGEPIEVRTDGGELGLMEVDVPAGEHILAFRFGDPPLRRAANTVSLVSLLGLTGLVGWAAWQKWSTA
jgi:hypothetical protein